MTDHGTYHIGRSWSGHPLEDQCPCPQEPCGLVRLDHAAPGCDQHPPERAKSIRQAHPPERCPICPDCLGDRDTVCAACNQHACWCGQSMCDEAATAGTRQVKS